MKPDRHAAFIRQAIKHLMRARGLRYEDLARALGVSLPTVKRSLTKETLTLERLSEICKWLEVEFYDLIALAKSLQDRELLHLTHEQEEFLVRSPQACRFLIEIMNFQSLEQIARKFGLTQKSVDLYVADLQKARLISRESAGEIRVVREVLRGPRPNGPLRLDLAKRYQKFIPILVARELESEVRALEQTPPGVSSETLAANGFNLTKSSQRELLEALKNLRNRFAEIERLQSQTVPAHQLSPVRFVTMLVEGSIYAEAYGEIRNR